MTDIYAPPSSQVELTLPPAADLPPAKKPKAILLLQVWAIALIALVAVGLMKNIHNVDGRNYGVIFGMAGKTRIYLLVGIIIALLAMLHGLDRRSIVGRILGLAIIVLTASPVYLQFFMPMSSRTPAQLAVTYAVIAVFCLPFVYWGFALSFSQRARRYFAEEVD